MILLFRGLACCILLLPLRAVSQSDSTKTRSGFLSGSVQIDAQRYEKDKNLPFQSLENKFGLNTYLQLAYQYKNFRVGLRAEGYTPALIGYSNNLSGIGLANRFLTYQNKKWGATLGNFYEQFGNGLVFRSQEQRSLGMDTSVDGFKINFTEKRYAATAFTGRQRIGFEKSDGWLSGFDNSLIISDLKAEHLLKIGGSLVHKKEVYDGILTTIKPNVWAWSSRVNYVFRAITLQAEYAQKTTDPAEANRYITRFGRAFLLTSDVFFGNFTSLLQLKRTENMDFRSHRGEMLNNALVNYIPNTTKQQTYRLLTLYPYASQQALGEVGGQLETIYSLNGGGSTLVLNLAAMNGLKRYETTTSEGYTTKFFEIGDYKYFRNINLEYEKQWSETFRSTFQADFTQFNREVILGGKPEIVTALTAIADGTLKLSERNAIHAELQHLATKQDQGNWAMALVEFSISPTYFFYASDEVNYRDKMLQNVQHYYNFGTALKHKTHRLSISYGRVREGLLCVGGICRLIPAYKGLSVSVTSSF